MPGKSVGVSDEFFERAHGCYSGDALVKNKIKGVVRLLGRSWACTGASGRGGVDEVYLHEVVAADAYDGETGPYPFEADGVFYRGQLASHRGKQYVLTGKKLTIVRRSARASKPVSVSPKAPEWVGAIDVPYAVVDAETGKTRVVQTRADCAFGFAYVLNTSLLAMGRSPGDARWLVSHVESGIGLLVRVGENKRGFATRRAARAFAESVVRRCPVLVTVRTQEEFAALPLSDRERVRNTLLMLQKYHARREEMVARGATG